MTVRRAVGLVVAISAGVALVVETAPAQLASEHVAVGSRPPPWSEFEGRFSGPGNSYSHVWFDTGPAGTAIRGMVGALPARCVVRGQVKLPVRDGAIEIAFDLGSGGKTTGSRAITSDGVFSLRYDHRGGGGDPTTYTVWIRGTFSKSSVRGRVKGVAKSDFAGSCRGDRAFSARRTAK